MYCTPTVREYNTCWRRQALAQPALYLARQSGEGGALIRQGLGDVLGGVFGRRLGSGRLWGGGGLAGSQTQGPQPLQRLPEPGVGPFQAGRPAVAKQVEVEQGGVAAVQLEKPVRRLDRHGQRLTGKKCVGQTAPPPLRMFVPLFYNKIASASILFPKDEKRRLQDCQTCWIRKLMGESQARGCIGKLLERRLKV